MADVKVSVVKTTLPTSTGNFNIVGDLDGDTPKLALFFVSGHRASNDPSDSNHAQIGIGAVDGTNQAFLGTFNEHNVASVDAHQDGSTGLAIEYFSETGASSIIWYAIFVSFSADTVTLDCDLSDGVGREVVCVLFGGDDFQGAVGHFDNIDENNPAETGLAFEPDVVLGWSAKFGNQGSTTLNDGMFMNFGAAANDGGPTQYQVDLGDRPFAAATDPQSIVRNDSIGHMRNSSTINSLGEITITAFNSDGFNADNSNVTVSHDMYWVALYFGGNAFDLHALTTPTSTGTQAKTGLGFEPGAVIMALTANDTINNNEDATAEATSIGFGAFTSAGEEGAVSVVLENGADPTNNASKCSAVAIMAGVDGSDADAISASFDSVGADGYTLDYTAVNGTARLGWALAIQTDGAAAPESTRRPALFIIN